MARITLGIAVSDMRGKVGGSVFQKGNSGIVLRNNAKNINKQNGQTSARRSLMQQVQQKWGAITADQRQSWSAWSAFSPIVQYNNPGKFLSGHQCFIQINFYRSLLGLSMLINPVFAKSSLAPIVVDTFVDLGDYFLQLDRALVTANERLIYSISNVISPSVNNALNRVRFMSMVQVDSDIQYLTAPYKAYFGTVPSGNPRAFHSWSLMDVNTGSFTNFTNAVTIGI